MDVTKIPVGVDPPFDLNAIIEIPQGGEPVKYELNKESGAMFVDRFLHTAMFYPGNYGFIPHTLSADGDPCDVLVVGQVPVVPGAAIRCRPIGALLMQDEAGPDEKIVAVPVDKLHPFYSGVKSYQDLPPILTEQVAHFFQHYKDLEKGKWVTIVRWVGPEEAAKLVHEGMARAGARPKFSLGRGRNWRVSAGRRRRPFPGSVHVRGFPKLAICDSMAACSSRACPIAIRRRRSCCGRATATSMGGRRSARSPT